MFSGQLRVCDAIEAGIYPLSAGFLPGLPGSFLVGLWAFRRLLSGRADQGRVSVGGPRAAGGQDEAGVAAGPPRGADALTGPPGGALAAAPRVRARHEREQRAPGA